MSVRANIKKLIYLVKMPVHLTILILYQSIIKMSRIAKKIRNSRGILSGVGIEARITGKEILKWNKAKFVLMR